MSATDAQTDLRQAAGRIMETIQIASAQRWGVERTNALERARMHVAKAQQHLKTVADFHDGNGAPRCDNDHGDQRPAEFVMTMLDTTSLDAVTLFCGDCMKLAFLDWLLDQEVSGYEIRRLT